MKTSLRVNSSDIPLNVFTQEYIANVLFGIVRSFGPDAKEINLIIDAGILSIGTDRGPLKLRKDFSRQLIHNTIKGMLSPLKGVLWLENITISSRKTHKQAAVGDRK
ncbi:MAG: hypothetical protein EPN22_03940 [Nitrospirae bacterium]|nr:MAG: hypothetical protein EPN22_03940 [Nitrospirota bacterium]